MTKPICSAVPCSALVGLLCLSACQVASFEDEDSISEELGIERSVPASASLVTSTFGGGVKAGDTLTLAGGARGGITFSGLKGTASAPIVVRNDRQSASRVTIDVAGTTFGVVFEDCEYVVFDGSANPDLPYGIWVRTSRDDADTYVKVRGLSHHVTLRYLEIDGRNDKTQPGIGIDTNDHTVSLVDHPGFTIEGHLIEHNWVHDTRTEAMYLGSNNRTGHEPRVRNIEVRHNLIEDAGWDCINLKNAPEGDNLIHHNVCHRDGSDPNDLDQVNSITLQASSARIYNNIVTDSGGHGFTCIYQEPTSVIELFNNVIVRPGRHGYATKRSGMKFNAGANIEAYHNTIVDAPEEAMAAAGSSIGKLHDNLIAGAGVGIVASGMTVTNNLVTTVAAAGFVAPGSDNYAILPSSPAHDTAAASSLAVDFLDQPRPREKAADRGAYEVQPTAQSQALLEAFTGADGTPVSVHNSALVTETGAGTLFGNALRFDQDNSIVSYHHGSTEVASNATWTTGSSTALDRNSLLVRMSDADNFLACNIRKPQQDVRIMRVQQGMWTVLASATLPIASQKGYKLRCSAQGDSIRFFVDGTERVSARNAFNQTAVRHGLMRNAGSKATRLDDWTIGAP